VICNTLHKKIRIYNEFKIHTPLFVCLIALNFDSTHLQFVILDMLSLYRKWYLYSTINILYLLMQTGNQLYNNSSRVKQSFQVMLVQDHLTSIFSTGPQRNISGTIFHDVITVAPFNSLRDTCTIDTLNSQTVVGHRDFRNIQEDHRLTKWPHTLAQTSSIS
jgi:hypothetical protein